MNEAILIVDDDASITASLALLLKQHGYRSVSAHSPVEALAALSRERPLLVLQDMNFSRQTSGDEGLELLARIRAADPLLPVILITAWGSIALAVEGMKRGASDFITKPWENATVLRSVETALKLAGTAEEQHLTRAELDERYDFSNLIGNDPKIVRLLEMIGRVAATDASVLVTGESGTGKELVAEALHRNGRRRGGPFVKVNLGGISATLFESEMFGHVRGAFTDARESRRGRFELADGGTIFLDEIGELEAASQVKLLRVLQDRTFEVLGSSRPRAVDVRVVAATNRQLHDLVERGEFREDLLYRLNLINIHLPPLRDRRGDVPRLANHFLRLANEAYRANVETITPRAMEWLRAQPWPGNIRQLRQTIDRAVLIRGGPSLDVDDFFAVRDAASSDRREVALPEAGTITLDELEKKMIVKCMAHYDGNVSRAAEALGLSRAALYRRLEKYGISAE
ncbi:MAG: sigma-54-dependent Fis family transcriptional regulator [Acidobacteria bacterium]|nr:sigma-54-dependent Fis family transcriptional regulator [Acidobacteriota bacterium]MBV9476349.1 sigma-54-dependent Fis family transcriptional regulator [Acidobacteriota bacterium]